MRDQDQKILSAIAQSIFDKKGFNILALDVRGISSITDYFMIAEGNIARHVQALSHSVKDKAKEMGISVYHVDGEQAGGWIVIDLGNILVHLFEPDQRERYSIEELWHEGKIVDLNIQLDSKPSDNT